MNEDLKTTILLGIILVDTFCTRDRYGSRQELYKRQVLNEIPHFMQMVHFNNSIRLQLSQHNQLTLFMAKNRSFHIHGMGRFFCRSKEAIQEKSINSHGGYVTSCSCSKSYQLLGGQSRQTQVTHCFSIQGMHCTAKHWVKFEIFNVF